MALFNSVPAVSTQKDTTKPINKKPSNRVTKADLEVKKPLTESEKDELLKGQIKELQEEAPEPIYFEDDDDDFTPKKNEDEKPSMSRIPRTKNEAQTEISSNSEVKETKKATIKEEPVSEKEDKPLTPEEKKARQMENLRKARLAKIAQAKENDDMAQKKNAKAEAKPKKLVKEPKKTVDMSKMVTAAKKPQKEASGKTVYHVSKRGETREDRVWKVFIQESNKVIKLFDYQEEALEYAKQLAKNKNDGSYVVLHGLNGKIRRF